MNCYVTDNKPFHLACVVPVCNETSDQVQRCIDALSSQWALDGGNRLTMVMVMDGWGDNGGHDFVVPKNMDWDLIRLPRNANDAGGAPRAIGTIFACKSVGADAVGYCDADSVWFPTHMGTVMPELLEGADVVTTKRQLRHIDTGEVLFDDKNDSNGEPHPGGFCSPDCLVLGAMAARKHGCRWADFEGSAGCDRAMWQLLSCADGLRFSNSPAVTTAAYTPYLQHYYEWNGTLPKRVKLYDRQNGRSTWHDVVSKNENGWVLSR